MTSTRNFLATTAFAVLALAKGAAPVRAGEADSLSVKPIKAISLDVGSKRAIGYFIADHGACNLTIMVHDISDDGLKANATRLNMTIGAGTSSSLDTAEGKTLAFKCQPGAAAMTFDTIDRVAYEAARK